MTTNAYFSHYTATNEQNLIEDLVIESIQAQGLDVAYIPRTQSNVDYLYNEDPTNWFETAFVDGGYYDESSGEYIDDARKIEMYPAFVEGFDGDELMTMFGDEFKKSATFVVSKKRFNEEFPEFVRPREGDLIFMPITNAILEIKFVDHESPFFEKGKQYVYEVKVEAFEFSYESVQTGNHEIDEILDEMDSVIDPEADTEEYGQNSDIETDTSTDVEFDPTNPFGVR